MSKNVYLDSLDYSKARQADDKVYVGIQSLIESGEADTLGESAFQDLYLEKDDIITIPPATQIRAWVNKFKSKIDGADRKALYVEVWSKNEGGWVDVPVAMFRRQPLHNQMAYLWLNNKYGRRLFNMSSDLRRLEELAGKSLRITDVCDLHRPSFTTSGAKIVPSQPTVDYCKFVDGNWVPAEITCTANVPHKWIPRKDTEPYKELTCYKWFVEAQEEKSEESAPEVEAETTTVE
jgi:hypothetical protein